MAKTITCPACGNRGAASDDIHFEVRGQHQGRHVRKCVDCGIGVYVKVFGRSEVIPAPVWARMCEMWEAEFPPTDIQVAAAKVMSSLPNVEAAVGFAFAAAVTAVEAFFPVVLQNEEDWASLDDVDALERVVRVAIGPHLLFFLRDDQNRAYLSRALDSRPSETAEALWKVYSDNVLTEEEAGWVAELPSVWAEDFDWQALSNSDNVLTEEEAGLFAELPELANGINPRFSIKATRALRRAASLEDADEIDIFEALIWACTFANAAKTVDINFWSMVQNHG